jgi:hypothetical protein
MLFVMKKTESEKWGQKNDLMIELKLTGDKVTPLKCK